MCSERVAPYLLNGHEVRGDTLDFMTTLTNDIEEIRTLLAEYCFAIDSRDAERWAHLFTEDGIFLPIRLTPWLEERH